jgi:hypothetical protein
MIHSHLNYCLNVQYTAPESRSVFKIRPASQISGFIHQRFRANVFSPNALPARRCRGGREIRRSKPGELIGRWWRRRCRRIPSGGVRRWRQQAFQLLDNTPVGFWDQCLVHADTYTQCSGSGSGIRCLFDPPGSGMGKNSRSGSGMNIPDHILLRA